MSKTTFRLDHHLFRSELIVEIWFGDKFIGQITPLNVDDKNSSPGVKVTSKYDKTITQKPHNLATEIRIIVDEG
jgi:hypothetical protein